LLFNQLDSVWVIQGKEFKLTFNLLQGQITSWKLKQDEMLMCGGRLNVWRAPTSNDLGTEFNPDPRFTFHAVLWKQFGLDDLKRVKTMSTFSHVNNEQAIIETQNIYLGKNCKFKEIVTYTIDPSGKVNVKQEFTVEKPKKAMNLPRVGMVWELNANFSNANWLGRGPFENYLDRSHAAYYGAYKLPLNQMQTAYIKPQENGTRFDVDKLQITNNGGRGFEILGKGFGFSVHPYSLKTLTNAKHTIDLQKENKWYLYIDLAQNAIGSESFMYNYLDKYILKEQHFIFEYSIQAIELNN
jgi:hypothetical protein